MGQRSADHLLRALGEAVRSAATLEVADRLSEVAAERTGSRGASLSALFAPDMSVPIGVSGDEAALAERIQFSAGQGPCWQAFTTRRPVRVPDVAGPGGALRWPRYAEQLLQRTSFRAVLAVPVRLASGLLVALTVYSDEVDPVGHRVDADDLAAGLAEVLDAVSPPPDVGGAAWLDSSSSLRRAVVWMAEAHVMEARGDLGHEEALEVLRTHAADAGTTIDDVAVAVVAGRLPVERVLRRP